LKDGCGVCTNLPGYNSVTQCLTDCKGIHYRLDLNEDHASYDTCGTCIGISERAQFNAKMDECGECWPLGSTDPSWNRLKSGVDTQGVTCQCGFTPKTCVGYTGTTYCTDCPVPPSACPGGGTRNKCTLCPSDTGYSTTTDECGSCCPGSANYPFERVCGLFEKDDCGVCFGGNVGKANPCSVCGDWNSTRTCDSRCPQNAAGTQTCDDVCQGTYIFDTCLGTCRLASADSSCCGNSIRETGEDCDGNIDGNANTKDKDGNPSLVGGADAGTGRTCLNSCNFQAVAGNNNAAVIGGVLGAIGAVLLLAVAAFFAYKYAVKSGLLGKAGRTLDMSSSQQSPLYKGQTSVQHNPLYGA